MLRRCLGALGLAALAGCGAGDGSAPDIAVWQVDPSPVTRIGEADGPPEHTLYRVAGVTRLADGRIVVADGSSSELRVFSTDGRMVDRIGGRGRGPGEFGFILRMDRLRGDTLVVLGNDRRVGVVTVAEGVQEMRVWRYPLLQCHIAEAETIHFLEIATVLLVAEDNGSAGCRQMTEGSQRTEVLLVRYDWEEGRADTLGIYPGLDRTGPDWRVYGRDFVVALHEDRLFAGDTGSDSVFLFTNREPTPSVWKLPLTRSRIPSEAKTVAEPPPGRAPDGTERRFTPYDYPEFYPAFARLIADARGFLWIMRYPAFVEPVKVVHFQTHAANAVPEGGAEWVILDRDGEWVATATTPSGLHVVEIGDDYVLGLARDEYGVELVRLHRLTR